MVDAVAHAEECVRALGFLADNLSRAAGGELDGPKDRAREHGYHEIDGVFRAWLVLVTSQSDTYDIGRSWQRALRRVVGRLGAELVRTAGDQAWVGRTVGDRHLDSALAERWFWTSLRKALPLAFADESDLSGPAPDAQDTGGPE